VLHLAFAGLIYIWQFHKKFFEDGGSIMGTIGGYLNYLCRRDGISYTDLAKQVGLSDATIDNIAHDRRKVKQTTLGKIAKFFKVPLDSFYSPQYPREYSMVGTNIRNFCAINCLSYTEFAIKAGIDYRIVVYASKDKHSVRSKSLELIAKAMGISRKTLINDKVFDAAEIRTSQNLKTLCMKNNISYKELADRASIDLKTILKLERGLTVPRNQTVIVLAEALGVTAKQLKFGDFKEYKIEEKPVD